MRRVPGPPHESERGFVLVGVVMFVLALTILGISLFSLSGYEAQFTGQSVESEAAFFSACSGIEHAKFVLAKLESLGAVGDTALFPDPNVIYARARLLSGGGDDTLSAIPNLPPGTAIEIRVLARVGDQQRMVQANYVPVQTPTVYKRLISAAEFVHVKPKWNFTVPPDPNDPLFSSMNPPGGTSTDVWQSSANTSWISNVTEIDPSIVHVGPVPLPDLLPYFAQFWSLATDIDGGNAHHFNLQDTDTIPGLPVDVQFYRTMDDSEKDGSSSDTSKYSIHIDLKNPKIRLDGNGPRTAIWLIDHGIRINQRIDFSSDDGDLLVIVSKKSFATGPNPFNVPVGIWIFAGLDCPSLPVILVSDEQIVLEQVNSAGTRTTANYLTLFSRSSWLAGCHSSGSATTSWLHPTGHSFDAPNGRIDQLCEFGLLPNSNAGGTRFATVTGTWTELDPVTHLPLN